MTSVPLKKSTPTSASIGAAASIANELPEYVAFKSTLMYCAGILILPILAFFASKIFIFDGILSLSVIASNVCSAICAVLILHVSLGVFIYKAYSGPEKVTKTE